MASATSLAFQELDNIKSTSIISFYFFCYILPEICLVLFDWLTILKISRVSSVHPSLIAGEIHSEFSLEGRNLVLDTMLTTIKDSDKTLARLLVGRVCKNNMSIICLVGASFCPFIPVAFKFTGDPDSATQTRSSPNHSRSKISSSNKGV